MAQRCILQEEVDMFRIRRALIEVFEIFGVDLRDIRFFPEYCVDGEVPSEYARDGAVPAYQGPPDSLAYTFLIYGQVGSLESVLGSDCQAAEVLL